MHLRGTLIDDTFSEAFAMWAARLVVTAADLLWLDAAVQSACGYGTSIISCDTEVGLERYLDHRDTPDGRKGAAILFFARHRDELISAVQNRTGQCLMTCPTTTVFNGYPSSQQDAFFALGEWISPFGDGFEQKVMRDGRQGYVIPVTEGVFFCEASAAMTKAIGGGTLLIAGSDAPQTLTAARRAAQAIAPLPDVITPFPGGVCRCASKVGSRAGDMTASTNDPWCPSLRDKVPPKLPAEVTCVYEVVIDGLTPDALRLAMRAGIDAAAGPDAMLISSSNFGGRLGKTHLHLREIAAGLPGLTP
jgi:formylmethanofuran--tetrahydromethanopterin N-formyltransferase